MIVSGICPDNGLVEMIELPDHPWFVGCQFHPELKSRATTAHPLFREFVRAAVEIRRRLRGHDHMSPSILLRPGYFFTLIFSSAMIGAAALPLIMSDVFGLPAARSGRDPAAPGSSHRSAWSCGGPLHVLWPLCSWLPF